MTGTSIRVSRAELCAAFGLVDATIEKRAAVPVMACVRLRRDDKRLELFGSSAAGQVTAFIPLKLMQDGDFDICVPADKLAPLLSKTGSADVTFSLMANGRVRYDDGKCKALLPIVPGSTMPEIAQSADVIADFDIPGLSHLVSSVAFAADEKDIRNYCQGVWLESDGECVYVVATDVNTMAVNQTTVAVPAFGFMLMEKSAALLAAFDPDHLIVSNDALIAEKGEARLHMKKALLNYPAWRRAMPELKNSITFRVNELRDAISMHRFYDGKVGAVRFEHDGDGYIVRIKDAEHEADFYLEVVEQAGDDLFEYVFKGEQIAQIIQRAGDENVTFYWDAKAPRGFLVQNGTWRGVVSRITL